MKGGKFPGLIFPREIVHWEDLTEFAYENLSSILLYFCQLNFACLDVSKEFSWGYFQWVQNCLGNFSGGYFSWDEFSMEEISAGETICPSEGGGGDWKIFPQKRAFLE